MVAKTVTSHTPVSFALSWWKFSPYSCPDPHAYYSGSDVAWSLFVATSSENHFKQVSRVFKNRPGFGKVYKQQVSCLKIFSFLFLLLLPYRSQDFSRVNILNFLFFFFKKNIFKWTVWFPFFNYKNPVFCIVPISKKSINVNNVQTCKNFYEFIWSKLMTIDGKQNLSWLRKCSREWQLCIYFIHYNQRRKCKGVTWNSLVID